MQEITATILNSLPWKKKSTQGGWISFNAVCCHNNGQRQDDRGRGGILPTSEGGVSYHCFNCGYTASWQPGRRINLKMRKLMSWLGVADDDIRKLSLFALANLDDSYEIKQEIKRELPTFEPKDPCPGRSIMSWLCDGHITVENYESLEQAIHYLDNRGLGNKLDLFHWTDDTALRNRVLVPFSWMGKPMGYSGRLFTEGAKRVKYLSSYPSGMMWGYDQQLPNAKFCLVVEGLLDAVSVNGVGVCSNEISETQALIVDSLNRDVIVVPDRDKAGMSMVRDALNYGWNVSFPDWGKGIKDVADAVREYGVLYTVKTVLDATEHSSLKIQLMAKKWV